MLFAAAVGIGILLTPSALAQSESVLYSFAGAPDGRGPSYNLVQDAAGNLYGVTAFGGVYDGGTVFELSMQNGVWVEKILHSFGGVVMDGAGNLYGTAGFVYELTPDGHGNWTETILKTFKASSIGSLGGLTLDAKGRLYGIAYGGIHSLGLVFRLSPPVKKGYPWKYTQLYAFQGRK